VLKDVFAAIKTVKNLETLSLTVLTKPNFIKLLNQNLNKEASIKHLDITF
jgi:hypothetical protein